jgi:hypothetical protein
LGQHNIITIQGTNTIISILVTKKLGAITKRPKVLVCYDFHSRIFDKEEDLMFTTKPILFSIRTIVVLTLVWSYQPIKLITSTGFTLVEHVIIHVEHVFESLVSFVIHVKLVFVLLVKIVVPHDNFQQHLPLTYFQPKVGKMEIDKTPTQIKVQNLRIA